MVDKVESKQWTVDTTQRFLGVCPEDSVESIYKSFSTCHATITKGENFPDWKGRIKRCQSATTTLEVDAVELEYEPSEIRVTHPCKLTNRLALFHGHTCQMLSAPTLPSESSTLLKDADSRALEYYLRKIKEVNTAFEGGVALGELGETIRMVKGPAFALRNGVRDYLLALQKRRRGITKHKHLVDMLSGTWLEYTFGWRPLMMDIKEGMKAIHKMTINGAARKYIVGLGKETAPGTYDNRTYRYGLGLVYWKHKIRYYQEVVVIYRGVVRAKSDGGLQSFDPEYWGLDLSQFVPTCYELMPYSWLLDYFTNIGQIVNAVSTGTSGVCWTARTVVRQGITKEVDLEFDHARYPLLASFRPYTVEVTRGKFERRNKHISRSEYTGALVPNLRWHMPTHWTQYVNMAAVGIPRLYRKLIPLHSLLSRKEQSLH